MLQNNKSRIKDSVNRNSSFNACQQHNRFYLTADLDPNCPASLANASRWNFNRKDILAVLGDLTNKCLVFTEKKLFELNMAPNVQALRSLHCAIDYAEIAEVYDTQHEVNIELKNGRQFRFDCYPPQPLYDLLTAIINGDQELQPSRYAGLQSENSRSISDKSYQRQQFAHSSETVYGSTSASSAPRSRGTQTAGTVYGNVSSASTIYGEEKFHAVRGHGFAAERANTLYDKLTGHNSVIVGDDNAKNGADRMVDGISIQSKYCSSGRKCIQECFDDGKFRYLNPDGTPMQIEVPSDKYEDAVKAMQERIRRGQVPGVTDPAQAKDIVRQGHFTYEQVKNIAKAGTIESLTYDAVNGSIITAYSFGITTVISFAVSIWNGEDIQTALNNAALNGLKVGGLTFANAILAGQLVKTGAVRSTLLNAGSEYIVSILGPKGSAFLVNAFRSGSSIYGAAAMKSLAKLLRSNMVTAGASIIILSSVDVADIFRGRISGAQLMKNITGTAAAVAGGTGGWVAGSGVGASVGATVGSVVPVIGTAAGAAVGGVIGGLTGSFTGGSLAGKAANAVLDGFIEDDANQMVRIIEKQFMQLAEDYLLTGNETKDIVDTISKTFTGSELKDMYASSDQTAFANNLLTFIIEMHISRRKKISKISRQDMQMGLRLALEYLADAEES
ncbi:MAG: hypothetical protein Q4F00_05450 [bacterium]|nr:hypothetical protein [bacterium]